MKLAVSNIAWSAEEDTAAIRFLVQHRIRGLEVAPPRLWPRPAEVSPSVLVAWREKVNLEGLEVVALQSLLFGRPELRLFEPDVSQSCFEYVSKIGSLGAVLGAKVLVLGSPRQRAMPQGLSQNARWKLAQTYFHALAQQLSSSGVVLALEPNPVEYGGNFIHTVEEAALLVRSVNHPAFRLHLDAGELQMNNEDIRRIVIENADLISHVHASEPRLVPISNWDGHRELGKVLKECAYTGWISLEMVRPNEGLSSLEPAVERFVELYS